MAISVVGTGTGGANAASLSHPFTLPTGIQTGDKALVVISCWSSTKTWTVPSSWTLVNSATAATLNKVWVYQADVGASDSGATVTFTSNATTSTSMAVVVLRGVVSVNGSVTGAGPSAVSGTATYPTITPTVDDAYHLVFAGLTLGSGTVGTMGEATGWTEARTHSAHTSIRAEIQSNQYSGGINTATGTTTSTVSPSSYWSMIRVALEGASVLNGGYTAQPMIASESMPGGYVPVSKTIAAQPMTASASLLDASVIQGRVLGASRDALANGAAGSASSGSAGNGFLIDFDLPNDFATSGLVSATLSFRRSNGTGAFTVKQIEDEWTTGVTYTGDLSTGTVSTGTGGTTMTADVTSILTSESFYGFRVFSTAADWVYTTEGGFAPTLSLQYKSVSSSGGFAPEPMSADATLVSPTVGIFAEYAAQPMTASGVLVEPIIVGQRHVNYVAEPSQAFADMGDAQFAVPVTVVAEPMTAAGEVLDLTVETTDGVNVAAEPMRATAVWKKASLVNGQPIVVDESEDNYFARVNALTPKVWLRLNDAGSTALDRVTSQVAADYVGVQVGKFDAPENRHSVHFPGGGASIVQREPTGSSIDEAQTLDGVATFALEFSLRTTKANTFLMGGVDNTQTTTGTVSQTGARELFLRNGRINFKARNLQGNPDNVSLEFTGFTNLADGAWHHVVVRTGATGTGFSATESGVEVWVDGKFEVRRLNGFGFIGFPDYIGYRPDVFDAAQLEALPLNESFEGDMSEVVLYTAHNLNKTDIPRNYYAFMGWTPVVAEPAVATATMADAKAKGNQKRALYLYWYNTEEWDTYASSIAESLTFDPIPGWIVPGTAQAPGPQEPIRDWMGYKVFAKGVTRNLGGTAYRDVATDDQSIISLDVDVDMDDYDLIVFKDWPDESYELDVLEANYPGQKERFIAQVRKYVDQGKSLLITNPRMAVDFGVIDRVEFVPTLQEGRVNIAQGNASGLYDYKSALDFPWDIAASDGLTGRQYAAGVGVQVNTNPAYLANKAYYYHDTNHNNRFRVRALIEGLTDIPSFMIDKAIWHVDADPFGWQGAAYKYLDRKDGLLIGDEYIYQGSEEVDARWLDAVEKRYSRFNGTFATPPGHVLAGTVVTTFGAKHWVGNTEVDNPFANYATTIVVQPGDTLRGTPVGGRIFVNFTEQPKDASALFVQVLPDADNTVTWPAEYGPETASQKEWDWSWTRTTLMNSSVVQTEQLLLVLPDGTTQVVTVNQGGSELTMTRSNQLFPVRAEARMEMVPRGVMWLSETTETSEGDVVARATPMGATAAVGEPVVVAQKSSRYNAQPMLATATVLAPDEAQGDVNVLALPMTAEAEVTGYSTRFFAQPMTANAELVESFDMVHATGEQVVLRLLGTDLVTLYIKEEA